MACVFIGIPRQGAVGRCFIVDYGLEIKMGKQKDWSPTDPRHFEGKSISALQKRLIEAEEFAEEHPQFKYGWANEYRGELKRRIAEKIGVKK